MKAHITCCKTQKTSKQTQSGRVELRKIKRGINGPETK